MIISHFNYVSNVDYFLNIKPKRWFKSGEQQIGMKFICKVRCHHNNQAFCVRMTTLKMLSVAQFTYTQGHFIMFDYFEYTTDFHINLFHTLNCVSYNAKAHVY